jgi:hypothetical protein
MAYVICKGIEKDTDIVLVFLHEFSNESLEYIPHDSHGCSWHIIVPL